MRPNSYRKAGAYGKGGVRSSSYKRTRASLYQKNQGKQLPESKDLWCGGANSSGYRRSGADGDARHG